MPHPSLDRARRREAIAARRPDAFSTAVFTGANVAVFLILALSVVFAAVLYSRGA